MELFNELMCTLEDYPFSIKLIDRCKLVFQYGGWENKDFTRFKKLFYKNVNESGISLSSEKIDQILSVIYNRGCLTLEDILFIDGAAFSVKKDYRASEKSPIYIDFVWNSDKYKWCDFLDTTFFFSSKDLEKMDKSILPKLREEINMIFVDYFGITSFPERLGMNDAINQEYAIYYKKDEVIDGFINNNPFNISMICKVLNKKTVLKLDIICDTNNNKFLTVTNVDDNVERLSEIINQHRYLNIEEKPKCMIKNKDQI